MHWSDTGITEFNSSTDTYEHELIFYNYDNEAYATTCAAYQTNLPDSYLDTQFGDDEEESNIAVGTTSANDIVAGYDYYIVYCLDNYKSSSSKFKMQSQEGYYVIAESTWTTFAQSTGKLLPFHSSFTAPSAVKWCQEVEPNGNNDLSSISLRWINMWCLGIISTSSDVDCFKVRLDGATSIRLICPSGKDYDLKVYTALNEYVVSMASFIADDVVQYTLEIGIYYVKVYSSEDYSLTSPYFLVITQ